MEKSLLLCKTRKCSFVHVLFQGEIDSLKTDIGILTSDNEQMKNTIYQMKDDNKELKQENQDLKGKLQELNQTYGLRFLCRILCFTIYQRWDNRRRKLLC